MEQACREKASKYIENVKGALSQLEHDALSSEVQRIVELAKLYLSDASYYLGSGDCLVSIACSSYAEGLLDSLRMLRLVSFEWKRPPEVPPEKRVLVGGVFDLLHRGHIYFLRKAREYGRVYVVVARDKTVLETKGRLPVMSEEDRVLLLNNLRVVEEAFLGDYPPNFKSAVERVRPDYIVLGKDQEWLMPKVEEAVKETGLSSRIIVLAERIEGYSSSALRKRLESAD